MKRFPCPHCGNLIFFENDRCMACGTELAFDPQQMIMVPRFLGPGPQGLCANAMHGACNWTRAGSPHVERCLACAPNRTLPDLSNNENRALWRKTEEEKRRLFYGLLRFGRDSLRFPLVDGFLQFDFLLPQDGKPLLTGHTDGLITLNLLEARDSYRELTRAQMGEPYRTLIGHLRHEIAHYYWPLLIARGYTRLENFRALFGFEENPTYEDALNRHYAEGPPPDWAAHYITAYASAHPWEDWAESWAYYLHLISALDTAANHGVGLASDASSFAYDPMPADAYREVDFEHLLECWTPLSVAINSLNRSLGTNDPSPFILNPKVKEKLRFIHSTIHGL